MSGANVDEAHDATRRTRLANERTYLAWWRTGLTTFAVSVAAGKLVPELSSGAAWPFEAIGVAFAVVGTARWSGAVFLLLALSIALACVVGRYHYIVDVAAGAVVAVAVWVAVWLAGI